MLNILGMGIVIDANNKASREIDRAKRSFKGLEDQASKSARHVRDETDRMTAALSRYARGFVVGMKLIALGVGAVAPSFLFAREAAQSERTLAEVKSLLVSSGMSKPDMNMWMERLGESIDDAAQKWSVLYTDIETASYDVVSAVGIEAATGAIDKMTQMALAGKGTMTDAVDVMTSAFLTFGRNMDPALSDAEKFMKIADLLAGFIHKFKVTLPTIRAAFTYAGGIGASMGQQLEDVLAWIAQAQTMGQPGTTAGTGYAAFVKGIARAYNDLKGQVEATGLSVKEFIKQQEGGLVGGKGGRLADNMFKSIILNAIDAEGKLKPVYEVLADFEKAAGPGAISLAEYGEVMEILQDEGSRSLVGQKDFADQLRETTAQVRSISAATDAANIVNDTFMGTTLRVRNTLSILSREIGETLLPTLAQLLKHAERIIERALKFVEIHPNATKWIVFGTALAGMFSIVAGSITLFTFGIKTTIEAFAIILEQGGKFIGLLTKLARVTKIATVAQWAWNAASAANPWVWIIIGIMAAVAAIVLMVKHWDKVKAAFNATMGFFGKLLSWFKNMLDKVPDWILIAFPVFLVIKHWEELKSFFIKFWMWMGDNLRTIKRYIDDMPTWFLAIFAPLLLIVKYWEEIGSAISWVWDMVKMWAFIVKKAFGKILSEIKLVIDGLIKYTTEMWDKVGETIKSTWTVIKEFIIGMLDSLWNSSPVKLIRDFFDSVTNMSRWVLHNLGFGESFTGIETKTQLPPPSPQGGAAAAAGGAQFIVPPAPNVNQDYSRHKNNINIFPQPNQSPSDIARETDKVLRPDGEM